MKLALLLLLASCDRPERAVVEVAASYHVPPSWVSCVRDGDVYRCDVRGIGEVLWVR